MKCFGSVSRVAAALSRRHPRRHYATSNTTVPESIQDEEQAQILREATKTMSFINPAQTDVSPELRDRLNAEFQSFIKEFVYDVDLSQEFEEYVTSSLATGTSGGVDLNPSQTGGLEDGNMRGRLRFPHLQATEWDAPYSPYELYARQLFHAKQVAGLGAGLRDDGDLYRPHEDVFKPASKPSISLLLAAGAHLGHATSRARASTLPYVYGVRDGIHIIDLEQTLTALRRAIRVTQAVSERGGIVLFVGTRPDQRRPVEIAADRCGGYYVHTRWIPGTLTNALGLSGTTARVEVDMSDEPTGRKLGSHLEKTVVKPDLCIVLNPVENRSLLSECIATRVPTIGIVDTDSEPSLLTYPIPGNDDSLRFSDLVLGLLSNSARRGRDLRHNEVKEHAAARERAQSGAGFNQPEEPRFVSEEEIQLEQRPAPK